LKVAKFENVLYKQIILTSEIDELIIKNYIFSTIILISIWIVITENSKSRFKNDGDMRYHQIPQNQIP